MVRIEFTPEVAEEILAGHAGTEVDYAVNLWSTDLLTPAPAGTSRVALSWSRGPRAAA